MRALFPQHLSRLIRRHWAVENRLRLPPGCGIEEDRCVSHFPQVAQMLAALNTVVLSLMDVHRVLSVARQLQRFTSHTDEALSWVL